MGVLRKESSRVVAVAPNLDHTAHTKPDTRSKEGNNVFGCGCENGTLAIQRQNRPHDLANEIRMGLGSLSGGKGKQGGHGKTRTIIRHIAMEQ